MEYKPAERSQWTGRASSSTLENQYWYQQIQLGNINTIDLPSMDIALIGYACDEGVARNHGRIGARRGPTALRERLAKLPIHFEDKTIVDLGDIIGKGEDMEVCQNALADSIESCISNAVFPIAIGGGHDIAYGHFKGLHQWVNKQSQKKIGIINFDAHFDLRPVGNQPNSGTPFFQILNEFTAAEYFAIGIQQQSNTKELFDIAKNFEVPYVYREDCESTPTVVEALKKRLSPFIATNEHLYVTIDLDGFSSAYAPGVSAASPLGFDPAFFFKILGFILASNKVISLDIAELNPTLDRDKQTATLAARIVDFTVMHL